MTRLLLALATCAITVTSAAAQTAPPAPQGQTFPLSMSLKRMYDSVKRNVFEAAQKMPDADFAYRPTPDVRTYGELVAHIANAHYSYCSVANGEANPSKEDFEKTKTTKAALLAALQASMEYCDAVYDGATEDSILQMVKQGANQVTKASVLATNASHDNEHYGNMVTYLRLKKIVPPSTERAQQQRRGH